jgi:hypothetical protein
MLTILGVRFFGAVVVLVVILAETVGTVGLGTTISIPVTTVSLVAVAVVFLIIGNVLAVVTLVFVVAVVFLVLGNVLAVFTLLVIIGVAGLRVTESVTELVKDSVGAVVVAAVNAVFFGTAVYNIDTEVALAVDLLLLLVVLLATVELAID